MDYEVLSDEGRCPVCGTDGHNCPGTAGPPIHILPVYDDFTSGRFTVKEHVYKQVPISSTRMTTILAYHAGQVIPMAEAIREGLV